MLGANPYGTVRVAVSYVEELMLPPAARSICLTDADHATAMGLHLAPSRSRSCAHGALDEVDRQIVDATARRS